MNIQIHSRFVWRGGFILAIVFLTLAAPGRASAQGCTGVATSATGTVTWTPLWCQEFNATVAGPPDTMVWNFDLGNNGGWGNGELEAYCGPPGYSNSTMANPPQCANSFLPSTSNAYLDGGGANGHLVIQAINGGTTWTSARMKTQGIFLFGRIEASIKLPDTTNQGLWPAFWSLGNSITTGTPWPNCGEADFMEDWSPQVNSGLGPNGNRATIHTALTGGSGIGGSYNFPSGMAANTAFHAYGLIWSADIMQFYVDDATKPFLIKTPSDLPSGDTWPFNAPIFLLMNVAVGGTLGGTPDTSTPNPGIMSVDYVRLYAPSALPKPTLGNPPSITVKAGATTGNSSTFNPGLTPGTGFAYFTCSTNAPKSSCAISTSDTLNTHVVNSSASAAETVTVTVATTANAILPPLFFTPENRIWLPVVIAALLALLGMRLARSTPRRAWHYGVALVAACMVAGILIAGCNGGSSTTTTPPPNGTPPGSYTVTVYAFTESNISDGSNANADANVAIPLTVN